MTDAALTVNPFIQDTSSTQPIVVFKLEIIFAVTPEPASWKIIS
jgi:hypothetical protein